MLFRSKILLTNLTLTLIAQVRKVGELYELTGYRLTLKRRKTPGVVKQILL